MTWESYAHNALAVLVGDLPLRKGVSFASGRVDAIDVEVTLTRRARHSARLLVTLDNRDAKLRPWPIRTTLDSGVETGDPAFDRLFAFTGPPLPIAACFDVATRRRLISAATLGRTHHASLDSKRFAFGLDLLLEEATPLATDLLAFTERLGRLGHETREMLLEVYACDPHAAVRRRVVEAALAIEDPNGSISRLLSLAEKDRDSELRRTLADARAESSTRILLALVEDPSAPEQGRLDALRRVRETTSDRELVSTFERLLMRPGSTVREVALGALARIRHVPAERTMSLMVASMLARPDPRAAERVANALQRIPSERSEKAVLELLRGPWPPATQVGLVAALGVLGGPESVRALKPLSANVPPEVRGAVAEALARIARRLPEVEDGGLTLSPLGEARGSLSLASGAGSLTVAEPDAGALEIVD
ncbi:MAG: HEAT repeat domain-containing protein [Deltaproteobacteria bacterium]|nr:HEAT repeat domain-containing protein [Deltaproteobacteria bacterium]